MDRCLSVDPTPMTLELATHLDGRKRRFYRWTEGRSAEVMPWLQVIEAERDSKVHYLSSGASRVLDQPGYGTEFCYISNVSYCANVELLAMVCYLHSIESHHLGVGHTLNIGRPVAEGSVLDHLLVSLPYPYGSDFEFLHMSGGNHVRILWLLPISPSEEQYCHEHGLDLLEDVFEKKEIDFADPYRRAAV